METASEGSAELIVSGFRRSIVVPRQPLQIDQIDQICGGPEGTQQRIANDDRLEFSFYIFLQPRHQHR